MKSWLILICAGVGGFSIALATVVTLRAMMGDCDLATTIGTGIGMVSVVTINGYLSLWFSNVREIANAPRQGAGARSWRIEKARNKLRTAELRLGFVFAIIGAATASKAKCSSLEIVVVTVLAAIVGAAIGFDFKRRVFGDGEKTNTESENPSRGAR